MVDEEKTIDNLLKEFEENREAIKRMIAKLESLSEKIDSIFPKKLEVRYMRLFDEKVRSATELFRVMLNMRQELSKSLKDEIEIRRKKENQDDDFEKYVDISKLAKKVKHLQEKSQEFNKRVGAI